MMSLEGNPSFYVDAIRSSVSDSPMATKVASNYLQMVCFFFLSLIDPMEKWSKTASIFIDITRVHNRTVGGGGWTKSSGSPEGYKD